MRKIMTLGLVLVLTIVGVLAMVNPVASDGSMCICKDAKEICRYGVPFNNNAVPLGTKVYWDLHIHVENNLGYAVEDVTVKDRLGGDLELWTEGPYIQSCSRGTWTYYTKGKTEKVFIEWDIGDMEDGDEATLILTVSTDINPGGKQEYTSPCWHQWNSGATLKWFDPTDGLQHSMSTDSVWVKVVGEEEE